MHFHTERSRRRLGLSVSVVGVAHFVAPRYFDPINRLGFPRHARTFTYINGAIETLIGLLMANPRRRRLSTVVSACYVVHLATAILITQQRTLRSRGHVTAAHS
ncbi:hypothetical protein [Mycobacterium sp. ACS4331]|uniref:hypothetical protein n=1 Tax=Mycobacterium sp. ACS4331 TaxID=1834121 RepID=UPI0007FF8CED|nr:hypothetical protein [Mycobacterium sp. ACS4331]OBF20670.1 hypothetical protein A5727_09225 [Mycobacterium sp. ACS4331]